MWRAYAKTQSNEPKSVLLSSQRDYNRTLAIMPFSTDWKLTGISAVLVKDQPECWEIKIFMLTC